MRRTARASGIVTALSLTLIGCAGPSADTTFLGKMSNSPHGSTNNTNLELIAMAHNVCVRLEHGNTVRDIALSFQNMTVGQRGFLMGAGVAVYCPQYLETLKSYARVNP